MREGGVDRQDVVREGVHREVVVVGLADHAPGDRARAHRRGRRGVVVLLRVVVDAGREADVERELVGRAEDVAEVLGELHAERIDVGLLGVEGDRRLARHRRSGRRPGHQLEAQTALGRIEVDARVQAVAALQLDREVVVVFRAGAEIGLVAPRARRTGDGVVGLEPVDAAGRRRVAATGVLIADVADVARVFEAPHDTLLHVVVADGVGRIAVGVHLARVDARCVDALAALEVAALAEVAVAVVGARTWRRRGRRRRVAVLGARRRRIGALPTEANPIERAVRVGDARRRRARLGRTGQEEHRSEDERAAHRSDSV